jgi:hypothetical protein
MQPRDFVSLYHPIPRLACSSKHESTDHHEQSSLTACRCNRLEIDCFLKEPAPRKRRKPTPTNEFDIRSQSETAAYLPFELERGIGFYLKSISHYFPFIDTTKFHRLNAAEAPFLSLVVAMLGCTNDRARQRALAAECRRYLGKHVVENGAKSVDLLQGLLILVHWCVQSLICLFSYGLWYSSKRMR